MTENERIESEKSKLFDWAFSVMLDKNTNFHAKATIFSDMLYHERHQDDQELSNAQKKIEALQHDYETADKNCLDAWGEIERLRQELGAFRHAAKEKIEELGGRLSSMKISWDSALHGEAENLKAYRLLHSKISRLEESCRSCANPEAHKEALTQESAPPKQKEEM